MRIFLVFNNKAAMKPFNNETINIEKNKKKISKQLYVSEINFV